MVGQTTRFYYKSGWGATAILFYRQVSVLPAAFGRDARRFTIAKIERVGLRDPALG
jgi:hypothetical protein